jgi:hypothetical protein
MNYIIILVFGIMSITPNKQLTKENLWKQINQTGIKYPDLVFAQALLESGEFKSKLCKENKNLFGMQMPTTRKTIATSSRKHYAKYKHWTESVFDYKLYQEYIFGKRKYTRIEYINMLNKKYSETSDYMKRVHRVLKENKSVIIDNSIVTL